MVRLKQNILIVLIFILYQGNIYCQNSFPTDHLIHTKEIILLNTDKKIYLSGGEIWFSIKSVNAYSHNVSVLSKIAYVELFNNKKSAVIKKMISLSEGHGSSVIQIPPGLETGYYTLRVYTNWMKNFSKSHYTNCIISIVNPLDKTLGYARNSLSFRFYPESGNLVPGIPNRICYSILSQNEIKSGSVLDNEDNLVTTFTMSNIDIGSFSFIPEEREYTIIIKDELDSSYSYSLPAIRNDKSHLSIHRGPSFIEISVVRPEPAIAEFLEIEKFDSVFYKLELNNLKQIQIIRIDQAQIPYGSSMVHLKDLSGNTQCARPILNIGEDMNWLSCVTDKSQYSTREKVALSLDSKTTGSVASISIKKIPDQPSLHKTELLPLIYSKKTHINNWYGSSIDYRLWEDYMILNTDSWISIHSGDSGMSFLNPPEYNGHLLKGTLIPHTEATEKLHEVFITIKGDPSGFYASTISRNNMLYFPIRNLPINNSIILCNAHGDSSKINEITLNDPFEESAPEDSLPPLFVTNELLSYLEQASLNNQLKIAFSINNKIEYRDSSLIRSRKNLPIPKASYLLDKYTRFPVMEEVFREIIRNVYVRKSKGNYSLKVLDIENNVFFNQNPLILLDGLPIFEVNKLMKINPSLIESIEVVNSRSFIGVSVFDGVIYVNSYERDYADYVIDHNYNEMNYYHIDDGITYLTPDYSNHEFKQSRIPDFRNLLFWHPDIRIDQGITKKIEFYTSDDEGIYEIEITGINKDGSIVFAKSEFEVVKSN